MESLEVVRPTHAKTFDEMCPVCKHPQRVLIEKYYIARRPLKELERVFVLTKEQLEDHAKACKLLLKRRNNTAVLIDLILEQGVEKLEAGEFDMTLKDVAWAVGHRDKLLGRIKDKVEIDTLPILHIHTTVPGVGGIENDDIKKIAATKVLEKLDTELPTLTAEFEVEDKNVGK